jgi:hypothetical protein
LHPYIRVLAGALAAAAQIVSSGADCHDYELLGRPYKKIIIVSWAFCPLAALGEIAIIIADRPTLKALLSAGYQ